MLRNRQDRQVRMRTLVEIVDQRDEIGATGGHAVEFRHIHAFVRLRLIEPGGQRAAIAFNKLRLRPPCGDVEIDEPIRESEDELPIRRTC
jgi:hypothetical protein